MALTSMRVVGQPSVVYLRRSQPSSRYQPSSLASAILAGMSASGMTGTFFEVMMCLQFSSSGPGTKRMFDWSKRPPPVPLTPLRCVRGSGSHRRVRGSLLRPHLLEQKRPLLVRCHHIKQSIAIHVPDVELRPNARVVVDLVRRERQQGAGLRLVL